jgi:N-acetylglucosamine kinase-like BadF-type ATPase
MHVSKSLVIGIDGGQTTSRGVLATLHGKVLAKGLGGPILHLASEDSQRVFIDSIRGLLQTLWKGAGIKPRSLEAISMGLTGVTQFSPEADLAVQLTRKLVQANLVLLHSDAFTALKGAHAGKPGVVAISGTGMVVMGIDNLGQVRRCGGWGWVLGDEGSAFAIGRGGLRAALSAFDGTAPPTKLVKMFLEHFHLTRIQDVKRIYMSSDFGARSFGQLAVIVSNAARDGDETAQRIINENGITLARSVIALISNLDYGDAEVPVAPIGGAFNHIYQLKTTFENHLKKHTDLGIRIVDPEFPPVLGAVIIALERCGSTLDRTVTNLLEQTNRNQIAV